MLFFDSTGAHGNLDPPNILCWKTSCFGCIKFSTKTGGSLAWPMWFEASAWCFLTLRGKLWVLTVLWGVEWVIICIGFPPDRVSQKALYLLSHLLPPEPLAELWVTKTPSWCYCTKATRDNPCREVTPAVPVSSACTYRSWKNAITDGLLCHQIAKIWCRLFLRNWGPRWYLSHSKRKKTWAWWGCICPGWVKGWFCRRETSLLTHGVKQKEPESLVISLPSHGSLAPQSSPSPLRESKNPAENLH